MLPFVVSLFPKQLSDIFGYLCSITSPNALITMFTMKQKQSSQSPEILAEIPPTPGRPGLERTESRETVTMEHFLETARLDHETTKMLLRYDKDGNGSFSKDEVVQIILDLRAEMSENEKLTISNKLFKKLLCVAGILSALLILSMIGVSYAVAILTTKTDVDSSLGNALVKAGTHQIVSTDSRAQVHQVVADPVSGAFCVTRDEVEVWRHEVTLGRNVVLETYADSSASAVMLSGVGIRETGDDLCFVTLSGVNVCWTPDAPECTNQNTSGRNLLSEEYEAEHERLLDTGFRGHRLLGGNPGALSFNDGGR